MGDEFRTVREDVCKALKALGWTAVEVPNSPPDLYAFPRHWILTPPPEPTPPTLVDLLREKADAGSFTWPVVRELLHDAADALDHYALVEEAARPVAGASDRMMGNFVLVDVELLWKLADALNEGRKAPGADSL